MTKQEVLAARQQMDEVAGAFDAHEFDVSEDFAFKVRLADALLEAMDAFAATLPVSRMSDFRSDQRAYDRARALLVSWEAVDEQ